jgi:WD40 repeat protein
MTPEAALEWIEQAIAPRQLNKIQQLVFQQTWQGLSYIEIGKTTGYDLRYVKDTGYQLWRILSEGLGEKITKQNIKAVLKHYIRQHQEALSIATKSLNTLQDWGEAVDTEIFYGREQELETLSQWIDRDKCRLIAILGMGGIGKTTLSVRLAEQVQGEFAYLFWKSLRDAPPLDELLTRLLRFLSKENTLLADTTQGKISQLQECLRSARCLIVLDNFDALFQAGRQNGVYRPGYEDYEELLLRVGETRHQSCLMMTSREKPSAIMMLQGEGLPIREWRLLGLDPDAAHKLLEIKGVDDSEEALNRLIHCYQGNPLALKIASSSIESLFAGSVTDFLQQGTTAFNGIRHLLESQVERLSIVEQQVMYWLAINYEPASLNELQLDLVSSPATSVLLETLESLSGRSLIERTAEGFTLQPVVMEYLIDRLIGQIVGELTTPTQPLVLCQYALLKATARDYIRNSQSRLIVEPSVKGAIAILGSQPTLIERLKQLLWQLKPQNAHLSGYLVGNLINLFNHLQVDLTGYDFSHLRVWQAYLAEVKLQQVNLAYADLSQSVFAETFGGISCVAFSPDGTRLATSDTSGGVQIWDRLSGRQLKAFRADLVWTWAVAFSPDGTLLASVGDDHQVKLWQVETGECLRLGKGHTHTINTIAFHPRGHLLASGSLDTTIGLWPVDDFEQGQLLEGHQGRVWSVAFSRDGSALVSGSEDGTLKLWDIQTRKCDRTLEGHTAWVKSIACSPDGQTIASGSFDGMLKLWQQGECRQTWQGHQETVTALSFSPDGRWLASSSYDRMVKVWDVATGNCIKVLAEHSNRVWSVTFSPDGQDLASGGDDHATRLWHLKTGQCAKAWKGHTNSILALASNREGQQLATGHEDQTVKLWELQTGQISQILRGHENRVWSVAFAPFDGNILASGSADRTIKLWQGQTGQCLKTLHGHRSWVWSVAFSRDGHQLASCSYDHTLKIWDVESGECLKTLEEHTAPVVTAIYSSDGRWLASSSFDRTVKIWDGQTHQLLQTLLGHENTVWTIAFSPIPPTPLTKGGKGGILASGSYDRTVKLWDLQTGSCLQTFAGHSAPIMSLAFSEDGRYLVSGSFDRTLRVWDLQDRNCLRTLYGHTGLISALVFEHQTLISGSFDETIRLWNIQTGEELQTFRTPRPYEGMNITGVTGLTEAQQATLRALGAIERG